MTGDFCCEILLEIRKKTSFLIVSILIQPRKNSECFAKSSSRKLAKMVDVRDLGVTTWKSKGVFKTLSNI